MCGIFGYKVLKSGDVSKALPLFEALMLQSQVRGKHSTGVSWVRSNGKLGVLKEAISAKDFVSSWTWLKLADTLPNEMIGHCRYSTSGQDIQPITLNGMALVHNGIVNMADKDMLENMYSVSLETDNDSEIILQKMVQAYEGHEGEAEVDEFGNSDALALGLGSLYDVRDPIFALAVLEASTREILLVRDHIRPLWFFYIPDWGIVGFASTEDIIKRAFAKITGIPEQVIWKAESYNIYKLGTRMGSPVSMFLNIPKEVRLGQCFGDKPRYTPKPLVDKEFIARTRSSLISAPTLLDNPSFDDGDHRLNKRESFKRYSVAALKTWELDANYPMMQYLFKRYELSESQQYWACFLYGVFYHPGSVFYVMQEFPEFELVDLPRFEAWHAKNWRNLSYNTDRKYEKGHLVEMFVSYLSVIGSQTPTAQYQFFERHLQSTPYENFHSLWASLSKLVRFGRYSLFIYTECLARCMGLPIEANTIFLKQADSPRAGLCYVLDKPEWAKAKLSHEDWSYLEVEVNKLIFEINMEYPDVKMDHWAIESCLCSWKGYWRDTKGRYLGYYLDRMASEILDMQNLDITQGIDWSVLWQFRRESFPKFMLGEYANPLRLATHKPYEHVMKHTGRMIGLDQFYELGLIPKRKLANK